MKGYLLFRNSEKFTVGCCMAYWEMWHIGKCVGMASTIGDLVRKTKDSNLMIKVRVGGEFRVKE